MSRFQRVCLVHYHEIGLKGHNRVSFENKLVNNIKTILNCYPISNISRISGRICILFEDNANLDVVSSASHIASRIPGVARTSWGFRCERNLDTMSEAAVLCLSELNRFESFKVSARRNHTDFRIDSMQMNRDIGSVLCDAFPDARVVMDQPDVIVGVEVIQNASFIYAHSIRGIGGLPVGSSGKVVCLLSSGIDSPVALWRMAKRGAVCIGIHFSGRPQTSDASEYLVDDIAKVFQKTGCISKVYVVALGDYQRKIALDAPPELRIILYRRLMYKVAQRVAKKEKAKVLVTGESLGQVASQTIDNIVVTDQSVDLPIFRPLIGTDKQEIINLAQEIGTFDISSSDAPDCCTLFMPRNPETHAKLENVLNAESMFPIDLWIDEIMSNVKVNLYQ